MIAELPGLCTWLKITQKNKLYAIAWFMCLVKITQNLRLPGLCVQLKITQNVLSPGLCAWLKIT